MIQFGAARMNFKRLVPALLAIPSALASAQAQAQPMPDSWGFEGESLAAQPMQPERWTIFPQAAATIQTGIVRSGETALQLLSETEEAVQVIYLVSDMPKTGELTFSAYLKAERTPAEISLAVSQNHEGQQLSAVLRSVDLGTGDAWQRYETKVPINPEASLHFVGFTLNGPGTVYIDDIEIRVDGEPLIPT